MGIDQGFLNLNKPAGWTSHDCVAKVRRALGLKRVGHGGTLDPAATGVLPIALGSSTRLLQFLPKAKTYEATFRLGQSTTTDDLAGETIAQCSGAHLDLAVVTAALSAFQGQIQQVPPQFSAIQVQGRRLYQQARLGEVVEVAPRPVEIFSLQIRSWRPGEFPELDLTISCGPGTYIRSLARDLGASLGTGGTLACLQRTFSGGFHLEDSLDLTAVEKNCPPIPPGLALAHLGRVILEPSDALGWCRGRALGRENLPPEPLRVYDRSEDLLGIGRGEGGRLVPWVVLKSS